MKPESITIDDLFNQNLNDIQNLLLKTNKVLSILQEVYFGYSAKALEEDNRLATDYALHYEEVQTMLWIASDFVFDAKNAISDVMNFEILPCDAGKAKLLVH